MTSPQQFLSTYTDGAEADISAPRRERRVYSRRSGQFKLGNEETLGRQFGVLSA